MDLVITQGNLVHTINQLDTLPVNLYLKDKNGIYIGRNQHSAEKMHENNFETDFSKEFVLDKTDYDLFEYNDARKFREHDQWVLNKGQSTHFIEELFLPNSQKIQLLSIKTPIITACGESFVLGCSIDLREVTVQQISSQLSVINSLFNKQHLQEKFIQLMAHYSKSLLTDIVNTFFQLAHYYSEPKQLNLLALLSERQLQCLIFLCRGYSAKQIGKLLGISSRTVEIFIDQLKVKLKCQNKAQLVDWLWTLLSSL